MTKQEFFGDLDEEQVVEGALMALELILGPRSVAEIFSAAADATTGEKSKRYRSVVLALADQRFQ